MRAPTQIARGKALVAQSGGPTAVINASLYGVIDQITRELASSSMILGARGGIEGVLKEELFDLRQPDEEFWQRVRLSPGAALGSCRKRLTREEAARAVEIFRRLDVRYFFYIGGNDSMDTALKMSQEAQSIGYDLAVAGIPKTIDNDLPHTDHCPGFGSAARYFAQSAADLGIDVGTLPTPVSVLEVMGRNAGWLVAATMTARETEGDAPHLIYVPEVPLDAERFLADVENVYSRLGWVVAAISEGVQDQSGRPWGERRGAAIDGFGHALPGDAAASLAAMVTDRLALRARSEKPGLCGRSSSTLVSEVDRAEAEALGRFAVSQAVAGNSEFMTIIIREQEDPYRVSYGTAPLKHVANIERKLPREYLTPEQNNIRESYRSYIEPLTGGICRYARFGREAILRRSA